LAVSSNLKDTAGSVHIPNSLEKLKDMIKKDGVCLGAVYKTITRSVFKR
jgi:hypothetical protein